MAFNLDMPPIMDPTIPPSLVGTSCVQPPDVTGNWKALQPIAADKCSPPAGNLPPPPPLPSLTFEANRVEYAEEEEESMCQGAAPMPLVRRATKIERGPDMPPPPLPNMPLPSYGAKSEPGFDPEGLDNPLEFGSGLPMPEQLAAATAMGLPSLIPHMDANGNPLPFSEPPPAPGGSLPVRVKMEECRTDRIPLPPSDLNPDILGVLDPNCSDLDDLDMDKIDKKSLAGLPAKMVEQGVSARLNKLEKLTRLDESQLSGDQKNEKRRLMRLEKNRRAAAISRERKKRYIRSLEERSLIMAKHLAALEMENQHLRQLLAQYTGAPVPPPLVPPQQLGIELTPPPEPERKRKAVKRKLSSKHKPGPTKRRRSGRVSKARKPGTSGSDESATLYPIAAGLPPLIPKKEAN